MGDIKRKVDSPGKWGFRGTKGDTNFRGKRNAVTAKGLRVLQEI